MSTGVGLTHQIVGAQNRHKWRGSATLIVAVTLTLSVDFFGQASGAPTAVSVDPVAFTKPVTVPVAGPVICPFGNGRIGSSLSATSQVGIDGASRIIVVITDQYCNPTPGVAVTLHQNSATAALGTTAGITDINGKVTSALTNTVAESVAVTATIQLSGVIRSVSGSPVNVVFVTAKTPRFTALAGAYPPTNNNLPTITGADGETGHTVTVVATVNGVTQIVCAITAQGDGTWMCTADAPLPDGINTLTATQTDSNGTSAPSSPLAITVDTSPPVAPVITDPTDLDPASNSTQPTVTGTADPSEAGGQVAVNDATTGQNLCTAAIKSDGAWSCTVMRPLGNGNHAITATETDAAGNVGASSHPMAFLIDFTAPDAPRITSPTKSDVPSNQNTPTISGDDATPGQTVAVRDSIDGTPIVVCTTIVAQDGSWSCVLGDLLPDGLNTLTAIQFDASGQSSGPSVPATVLIKTTPSAASHTTMAAGGASIQGQDARAVS